MKKFCLVVLAFLGISSGLEAQHHLDPLQRSVSPEQDAAAFARVRARMDSIRQYRPTVALILGGGGAKGLAHLGVIRYLEENGIPVDLVGGTSMGGLVGGLYALGYTGAQMDSLVRTFDWARIMSDKVPADFQSYTQRAFKNRFPLRIPFLYENETYRDRISRLRAADRKTRTTATEDMGLAAVNQAGMGMPDGVLYGYNVRNLLSSLSVGYQDSLRFDDLPVPFFCVASDIYNSGVKYWTEGKLTDALRSTMAIPFYFRPVRIDDMVLLDGGTVNNYPVDVARAMGADIVIGSEMRDIRSLDRMNTAVDLLFQSMNISSSPAYEDALADTDHLFHHTLKGYNMLSFDSASVDAIIAEGYANAKAKKDEVQKLAAMLAGKGVPVRTHAPARDLGQHPVKLDRIIFNGVSEEEQRYLIHPRLFKADSIYTRQDIENILASIYGTGAFESLTYQLLDGQDGFYTLELDCRKGQVSELAVNVHADTDELVYLAAHAGLGTRKLHGLRFAADFKLGMNACLAADLSYRFLAPVPSVGLSFKTNFMLNTFLQEHAGQSAYTSVQTQLNVYLKDVTMRYAHYSLGFTAEAEPYTLEISNVYVPATDPTWNFKTKALSLFADFCADTRDDSYFPMRGFNGRLFGRYVFAGTLLSENVSPYFRGAGYASGVIPLHRNFALEATGWIQAGTEGRPLVLFSHAPFAGGAQMGRYTESQMPFFGIGRGVYDMGMVAASAQLALRYCLNGKNFFTLRGGILHNSYAYETFFEDPLHFYAVGLEAARKTALGPVSLSVNWCKELGVNLIASVGFSF